MPIVQIHSLSSPRLRVEEILPRLCRSLAEIDEISPDKVWATWSILPAYQYCVGARCGVNQPAGTHSPIVRLVLKKGRTPERRRQMAQCCIELIRQHLGLEEGNVFLEIAQVDPDDIFA